MTASYQSPDTDSLRTLYGLAIEFRELAPWKYLSDGDLFGVEDAVTGQTVWFSVMGALDSVYALTGYVGDAGLDSYLEMAAAVEASIPPMAAILTTQHLMIELVTRSELEAEDRAALDICGVKPGRGRVPQFRSKQAGFAPWLLDKDECALLVRLLPQVLVLLKRWRKDRRVLEQAIEGDKLPCYRQGPDGQWTQAWHPLPDSDLIAIDTFVPDDAELQRLRQEAKPSQATWELGFVLMGGVIAEKGHRPFYAGAFVCIDSEGHAYEPEVYDPTSWPLGNQAAVVLAKAISASGVIPKEIVSDCQQWLGAVDAMAAALGIELSLGETPHISDFGEGLIDFSNL